jgi:hypothetical protein
MSDTTITTTSEPSRSPDTGQFTSSEQKFGEEGVWIDQDYIPRPTPVKADADPSSDDEPWLTSSSDEALRALAQKKYGNKPNDLVELKLVDADGMPAPEKLAQTVEQAANDLITARRENAEALEATELSQLAAEVDAQRLARINGRPDIATYYGLDLGEVEAQKAESAKKAEAAEPAEAKADVKNDTGLKDADKAAETSDAEYVAPPDGQLHPDVERALQLPQVRQAIEQEFSRAETVRGEFTQALQNASDLARASFLEVAPELAGLSPEQFEQGLQMLSQVAPDRFNSAMNTLGRFAQIQQAQQQIAQQKATQQWQQFEAVRQEYSRAADAALGSMTAAEKTEMTNELVAYVGEHGISREQFVREAQTNLALHHPAFQKMAADAMRYQRLMKAPRAIPAPKAAPAVQKPGVAKSAAERRGDSISTLRAKAEQSGSVEDVFKLYQAKQSRR